MACNNTNISFFLGHDRYQALSVCLSVCLCPLLLALLSPAAPPPCPRINILFRIETEEVSDPPVAMAAARLRELP